MKSSTQSFANWNWGEPQSKYRYRRDERPGPWALRFEVAQLQTPHHHHIDWTEASGMLPCFVFAVTLSLTQLTGRTTVTMPVPFETLIPYVIITAVRAPRIHAPTKHEEGSKMLMGGGTDVWRDWCWAERNQTLRRWRKEAQMVP